MLFSWTRTLHDLEREERKIDEEKVYSNVCNFKVYIHRGSQLRPNMHCHQCIIVICHLEWPSHVIGHM